MIMVGVVRRGEDERHTTFCDVAAGCSRGGEEREDAVEGFGFDCGGGVGFDLGIDCLGGGVGAEGEAEEEASSPFAARDFKEY